MTEKEIVQALRCCAKGLGHDDACENCKVGEIQDRREYIEFAAANVIERLTAENAKAEAERDAALADLADARSCKTCKYACDTRDCSSCKSKTCKCRECHLDKNAWEWRGLLEAPEEITKIGMETEAGCVRAIARMYGVDTNRLRELTAADRDGRVLILPCKLGTKVYRIRYTIADYPDEPDLEIADTWFTPEYREDIGKTVFLTREEAERAMQEMEGAT